MEIEALSQGDGVDRTVEAETTQLKVSAEMQAAMERLFGGKVDDPRFSESMVGELMEFMAAEGKMDSPQSMLSFVGELERGSSLRGKHSMLDRAWHSMKAIQAQRAIQGLSRFE